MERSDTLSSPENQPAAGGLDPAPPGSWLARHAWWVILLVLVSSAALRLVAFLELNQSPCAWHHRWSETDMHFFDSWARDIASGDWLTDKALHPFSSWHKDLATIYLHRHLGEEARLAGLTGTEGKPVDPAKALWDRWYGGKQFHQEPLYAYLVAGTYRLFGADARWVFGWQLLLGALGNVLVYLIARRYFGPAVGVVAGVLAVGCGISIFYEMVLLRTALITVLGLLLVFLTDQAIRRGKRWLWFLCGLALGSGLLLNSTFGVFGLFLVGWLGWAGRKKLRRTLTTVAFLSLGAILCLGPVVARNLTVGAPPFCTSSVVTITFICANTADYNPGKGFFVSRQFVPEILAESDGAFGAAFWPTLRTHRGIGSFLHQLWGKFYWIWNWYEIPNNENYYYYRLHSAVLRCLPITFLMLAPLGLVGLCLAWRRFLDLGPLYALVLASLPPMLVFYVLSRFRAPMLAAVIPFAAFTLVRLASWWRQGARFKALLGVSALALLSVFWTARPLPADMELIRRNDYLAAWVAYYGPEVGAAGSSGRLQRAADLLAEYLDVEPPEIKEIGWGPDHRRPRRDELDMVTLSGKIRFLHARVLTELGRPAEAGAEERRGTELAQLGSCPKTK